MWDLDLLKVLQELQYIVLVIGKLLYNNAYRIPKH